MKFYFTTRSGTYSPFGGGRHLFMRHPNTKVKIPIPMHQGKDIPRGTVRAIIKQAGITVDDWQSLK